jgi:hypothetical protein
LQYSAVWARDGQIYQKQDLLQKSGLNDLVSIIKETFCQLKPKAENKRLIFLKKELEIMVSEARKDGAGSLVPMGIFEYESVIPDLKKEFVKQQNQMADYLETLVDAIPAISLKRDVYEDDIKETQQKCSRCTSNISSVQTSVFATIENLCNRLHLSVTDVFNEQCYFPEISSVPKVHHTTSQWDERIKKKLLCLQTESYHRALSKHSERFRSADGDEPLRYASRTLVILRTMKGLRLARAGR